MEEKDWTLVITEGPTGFHATVVGVGLPKPNSGHAVDPLEPKLLLLGVERPTEKQALEALRHTMFQDGYFD